MTYKEYGLRWYDKDNLAAGFGVTQKTALSNFGIPGCISASRSEQTVSLEYVLFINQAWPMNYMNFAKNDQMEIYFACLSFTVKVAWGNVWDNDSHDHDDDHDSHDHDDDRLKQVQGWRQSKWLPACLSAPNSCLIPSSSLSSWLPPWSSCLLLLSWL